MLNLTISKYLESHKRLVVPQLGAFIVKEPGRSVLFSELLMRDDGVLRSLLQDEGMGEVEAAGEIDRFVFEIRHAVEHGNEFQIDGFGVMTPGAHETIAFVYTAQSAAPKRTPAGASKRVADVSPMPPRVTATITKPHVSPSIKLNPEPYIKGLRYGKPRKVTDSYAYVRREGRRVDRFLLAAIIAAAIAMAAITFGYIHGSRDEQDAPQSAEQNQSDAPAAPQVSTQAAPKAQTTKK